MTHGETIVAGHFGEWLQGRLGLEGPVVLVTLPCPALTVRAHAGPGQMKTAIFDAQRLRSFLALLGLPAAPLPGLACDMPPGAGAGASTATLVAVARWAGHEGRPEDLARACLDTEGATDPLMWAEPDRLLWASREARILRRLTPPPPCEILGGFWGPPSATDPEDVAFDDVTDLVETWGSAVAGQDLADCARVATLSSDRCRARRGPDDPMADLARELGALGQVRAHTGSARGLIFAPGTVPPQGPAALEKAGLSRILTFRAGQVG